MTRLSIDVTFDERHGYTGTAPELRTPVRALSLNGLRKQVEDHFAGQTLDIHHDRALNELALAEVRSPPRSISISCSI